MARTHTDDSKRIAAKRNATHRYQNYDDRENKGVVIPQSEVERAKKEYTKQTGHNFKQWGG